ncbi:hypothetical protein EBU94_01840 [bacterium]|nr:hypothetical protein [bacterium]
MPSYYSLPDAVKSLKPNEVPIFIPVFNLVSYTKFMVEQLVEKGIDNFIICDNNSTYPPMVKYLERLSKNFKVLYLGFNFGPRMYSESVDILSMMPEWFVVTDPDLIFNKNLPDTFITDLMSISDAYKFSKAGFAMEIYEPEAASKFFDINKVHGWEGSYWTKQIGVTSTNDPIYFAPIDTTFAMHNRNILIDELSGGMQTYTARSARVAGVYTCEHMGWWAEQPIEKDEYNFYRQTQIWGSTENQKKWDNVISRHPHLSQADPINVSIDYINSLAGEQ